MEVQSIVIRPLAAEWEKVRNELRHPELHTMLRLMFFLGAHRAISHVVHAENKTTATALLRMELREFEEEIAPFAKDAAA